MWTIGFPLFYNRFIRHPLFPIYEYTKSLVLSGEHIKTAPNNVLIIWHGAAFAKSPCDLSAADGGGVTPYCQHNDYYVDASATIRVNSQSKKCQAN